MDNKEIKSLLKQAREAIKEKEYKTALKHCKNVLKIDKNNYNAWVFVGAAAQEIDQPDQSEAAFKRAIEIAPDQILAWQGLCSFYEKHESQEYMQELLSAYKKLIDLYDTDKSKKLEVYDKLILLLQKLKDKDKLIKVLKSKLDIVKGDNKLEYALQKEIFQELSVKKDLTECEKQMLIEALNAVINHETFSEDDCKRMFSTSIELLYKNGAENLSIQLASLIYQKFPTNPSCLEFLCRAAMNLYINNGSIIDGINEIAKNFRECKLSEGITYIFEGFMSFISKDYVEAIQRINTGLKTVEYCLQGWYLLAKTQLLLYQYADSEKTSKTGVEISLKSNPPSYVIGKFYLLLGQASSGRQNWDSALKAFEKSIKYLGQSKEVLISFCFTLLGMQQIDKAEKMCQELTPEFENDADVLQLEGYILFLKKDYPNALQKLRQSVALSESSYSLHLIGLVLWESEQKDKAFKVFIKAAELDPYFSKNFLYLGHYYLNNICDKSKACMCYQKAFHLDNTDTKTGMSLSHVLKALGKEEENMRILKIITDNASLGSCKWAWTQLGLSQLQNNIFSDAIFSLQNAVRADPNSSYSWECLADAYLKRGSYESALKAFERASELNPKAMYPLYQIATIQKVRGFFTEAIEQFKSLLDIVSSYVPALIGLAETYVLSAKKAFGVCLFGLSRDYCQEALQVLARVAASNSRLACLWKLAGDACTLSFNFDDKWFPLSIPPELHQKAEECDALTCSKSEVLQFGSKFFGRALIIKENVSTLWHDLGVTYHLQSMHSVDNNEKLDFAKKALICFQKAVCISPNYEVHWTALGVVAAGKELRDSAFGQHALIKSLQLNRNNAETWTNLGVLYLENENIELSHIAFRMAQSAEPTYPLSWVGQAFIADKVKHSETMDLYRHATALGSHPEALLGYSRSVCEMLLNTINKDTESYKYNIEQMNAVVVAVDCATKFVANKDDCPEAFNILGMLSERLGIYRVSLRSYNRALKLLERDNNNEYMEMVRTNYARMLSVIGLISEAIKEFLMLKKVDSALLCSFALTLHKAKEYEKALKLFKQAFDKAEKPGDKSHIKVAMAMVARNLQGPEFPNPLTLLFESSQISPVSVPGLLALFSVGVLNDDPRIALAAQKELIPFKFHADYCTAISFLSAALANKLKGAQAGRSELLKHIHCLPNNSQMWIQIASCLLQWDKKYASAAAVCTKIGTYHGGCKEQASQIFALCQIAAGYRKGALSAAQKAVHVNPGKLSNWVTLAAACHVADKDRKHVGWMFSFVKKLAKQQGIKSDLLGCLVVMEAFHYINCENMSDASALINQALSITSFNSEIQSALQILDAVVKVFGSKGNLDALIIAIKKNPKSFLGFHILCQILLSSGRYNEAEKTISTFAATAEKLFPKWKTLPLLQLAVLSFKAFHACGDEQEKWLKLGVEITGKAVHIAPSSQAARFLQGLFAIKSGNLSLAKRSFEKVVSQQVIKEAKWMEDVAHRVLQSNMLKKREKDIPS
ncbi:Tetratricopeptide repeat protein 37, partial [Stegodyphus mimosarum]